MKKLPLILCSIIFGLQIHAGYEPDHADILERHQATLERINSNPLICYRDHDTAIGAKQLRNFLVGVDVTAEDRRLGLTPMSYPTDEHDIEPGSTLGLFYNNLALRESVKNNIELRAHIEEKLDQKDKMIEENIQKKLRYKAQKQRCVDCCFMTALFAVYQAVAGSESSSCSRG